jgi:hypothetical protein
VRRFVTIAAMFACVVYATLGAWHLVVKQAATSPEASLERALETAFCHPGSKTDVTDPGSIPGDQNSSDCPVCKGCGAVALAILPAAPVDFLVALRGDPQIVATTIIAPKATSGPVRSRGPPIAA